MKRLLSAFVVAATALACPARAQDVASRPITLVVPFSPGSVVDIMARGFAEPFRTALGPGATVVVLNREGASGAIAAGSVAQARPDGTTIGFGPSGMLTTLPHLVAGLPYRFDRFEPICQVFENIFVMAVPQRSRFRSLGDLLAEAKARPETVSWGDGGVGTVGNLVVRQLEILTGARLTHAPYRNTGQMMIDSQSGTIDMAVTTWATVKDSGLRTLAVVADARQAQVPEAPTLGELGYPVAWRGFGGLWAPRGLPRDVAARLETACLEAAQSPAYRAVSDNTSQVAAPLPAEAFAERMRGEEREAAALLARLGVVAR